MVKQMKQVDVEFSDLSYIVKIPKQNEKKAVLNSVNGIFKSGQLTAIMGPSGAGKSSLLNILTGFTTNGVKGTIKIGNKKSDKKTRKNCNYILQDDNLFPLFTVEETMIMAAKCKLSKAELRDGKIGIIIDNVLDSLNLTHTKSTRCSNLSGGQKKRLSVALELIDNPPVLFLDEPTTGLDISASTYCIRLLHDLAREGRTIVCTIHQPSASIFELFDHVYVMADGNCIYQGSALNSVPYLSSNGLHCPQYHNAADYLLEVANGEYGDMIPTLTMSAKDNKWHSKTSPIIQSSNNNNIDALELNSYEMKTYNEMAVINETTDVVESSRRSSSYEVKRNESDISKLFVLMKRGQTNFYRDWTVTHLKLVLHVVCGFVVGLLFSDVGQDANKAVSNVGFLLVGVVYLWYTSVMPAALRFPAELGIIKKEIFNSWYNLRTYYISTFIVSTPIHFLFATVYSTISYFMTYQPAEFERYIQFVFMHILCAMIADAYGMFYGSLFNPINGTFFGAITTCFMLAFAGCLAVFKHMPKFMYYVSYVSPLRYGVEGSILALLDNNREDLICPDSVIYCHFMSPKFFLHEFGFTRNNYMFDVCCLIGQLILMKMITYFTLRRRINLS